MPDPAATNLMANAAPVMRWLLLCLALAVVSAPVVVRLLRGLPDRGLGLTPLLGILFAGTASWWMGQDWGTDNGAKARLYLAAATIAALGASWLIWFMDSRARRRRGIPIGTHRDRILFSAALLLVALVPVPFSTGGVLLALAVLAALSAMLWWDDVPTLHRTLRRGAAPGGIAIGLFIIGFIAFLVFRVELPGAYFGAEHYGAEKGGNMMHLASAMRTSWFPVGDAWFLGEPANYYNGGHIAVAMLAKGSLITPGMAFNLGVATIFGLTLSTAFSLGYNLLHKVGTPRWRTLPWALFTSIAVALFGNLDALHQVLSRAADSTAFSFWRSSRAYTSNFLPDQDSGAITEFPAFSALLGDLHPHHMALPIGMLVAALLVSLWRKGHRMIQTPAQWWTRCTAEVALIGIAMGVAFVINAWDAIVYAPIVLLVILATWMRVRRTTGISRQVVWPALSLFLFCILSLLISAIVPVNVSAILPVNWMVLVMTLFALAAAVGIGWLILRSRRALLVERVVHGSIAYGAVGGLALLMALPQLLLFRSPYDSSGPLLAKAFPPRLSPDLFDFSDPAVASVMDRTMLQFVPAALREGLWEYVTMWGLFVLPITALILVRFIPSMRGCPTDKACALVFGLLAIFCLAWNAITALAGPVALLLAVLCFAIAIRATRRGDVILWLLLGVAFVWHLFVEIFYFNDAYTGYQIRYNTPFKIMYPTWPLMAVGMVAALRQAFTHFGPPSMRLRGVQLLCVVAILRLGMIYPIEGAKARQAEVHPRSGTIDALAWMERDSGLAQDLAVIRWMQENIEGTPLMLEAPPRLDSASYTRIGRVASTTGIPTLVAWPHHQAQWRGWKKSPPEHLLPLMQSVPAEPPVYYDLFYDLTAQAELVYSSASLSDDVWLIIDRLGIELIFVGSFERERYGDNPAALDKFNAFELLHQSGDAALYRVTRGDRP